MDMAAIGLLLLDLLGSARTVAPERLAALAPADWDRLDALAQLHRLQPLLFRAHAENPGVPTTLRDHWRAAHRASAMIALVQDADLRQMSMVLGDHGIRAVALKGSYLASYAYPEAALRPRRDLDLLVTREQVLEGFAALREAGCTMPDAPAIPLEDVARMEVHMPVLVTPRGTVIELHARLSEPHGKLEYAMPELDAAAMLERARALDGLLHPASADLLDHLVIHAIYGHRLDCGPLLLDDIRFLAAQEPIDWAAFWVRACAGGWEAGARLVVELVRHYHGAQAVPTAAGEPAAPPAPVLRMAQMLLLQDFTTKKFARFLATLSTGGLSTVMARMTGRVRAEGEGELQIDRSSHGGRLRWALGQAGAMLRDLSNPAIRRQSRDLAQFKRWLEG